MRVCEEVLDQISCPSNMSIMDGWRISEAKQRFSEIVRRSEAEPQKIYNRERLVAVVVSPTALETLEPLREQRSRCTLAEIFYEIREVCEEDGYELEIAERSDRAGWPADES